MLCPAAHVVFSKALLWRTLPRFSKASVAFIRSDSISRKRSLKAIQKRLECAVQQLRPILLQKRANSLRTQAGIQRPTY